MNKLDSLTETQVVAMIARGDTYEAIISTLRDRDIDVTKGTITNIKKRNSQALQYMHGAMVEQATSQAAAILQKSRQLLEKKLDRSSKIDDELAKLEEQFEAGEIEATDYWNEKERILRRELTASELNAITKESFNQSQVEQGKPSSITDNPTQAKANLQSLLVAIKNGDEAAALKSIFLDA